MMSATTGAGVAETGEVRIEAGAVLLNGELKVPEKDPPETISRPKKKLQPKKKGPVKK